MSYGMESVSDFFFSSRRRHTRCLSDWSSDVCSSDLFAIADAMTDPHTRRLLGNPHALERSEERRVGKEWRSWGSPCYARKNSEVCKSMSIVKSGRGRPYRTQQHVRSDDGSSVDCDAT